MYVRVLFAFMLCTVVLCQDAKRLKRKEDCICFALYAPVCGVDKNTYSNSCRANCANVKVDCRGECPCKTRCEEVVLCKRNPCDNANCAAYPFAQCKPNDCNQCLAEFYIKGVKVQCEREHPPCPVFQTNVYCPDPCPGSGCPKFPDAECRRKDCYGCTPQYYIGRKIVDCGCEKKQECETNDDCCGEYCCKCGSGVYDPTAPPPLAGYCAPPGQCLCPPTIIG